MHARPRPDVLITHVSVNVNFLLLQTSSSYYITLSTSLRSSSWQVFHNNFAWWTHMYSNIFWVIWLSDCLTCFFPFKLDKFLVHNFTNYYFKLLCFTSCCTKKPLLAGIGNNNYTFLQVCLYQLTFTIPIFSDYAHTIRQCMFCKRFCAGILIVLADTS